MKIVITGCSAASAMWIKDALDKCPVGEEMHIEFKNCGPSPQELAFCYSPSMRNLFGEEAVTTTRIMKGSAIGKTTYICPDGIVVNPLYHYELESSDTVEGLAARLSYWNGLSEEKVKEEIRSLLSDDVNTDSLISNTILVASDTSEDMLEYYRALGFSVEVVVNDTYHIEMPLYCHKTKLFEQISEVEEPTCFKDLSYSKKYKNKSTFSQVESRRPINAPVPCRCY